MKPKKAIRKKKIEVNNEAEYDLMDAEEKEAAEEKDRTDPEDDIEHIDDFDKKER